MRMLLIWLLVFSTFVGVGCDSVGAPPKWLSQADFATSHSWLSQADFATSHSWLSQADFATSHSGLSQADFAIAYSGPSLTDYTTSFLAYHGREQFIRRRVAAGLSFGCQCHEVVFGLEGGRIGQRGRPNPGPLQTDTIRDTNVRCILGGLLHPERMARDAIKSTDGRRFGASGGRIYTGSSHLNNPVCGAYHSHGPVQSRLHPGPEYADERFGTGPCPTL